ncbi:MAG: 30S ribosomal protein S9 [Candidatus Paceibacterota bacterium]|jgi:small subunit ribosomal protein S9|nr:30S ribosomal protein S9 [Candidatus Paceibacterota bacterium]
MATKTETKTEKFSKGIGRRKTSTASVRLTKADETTVTVNGKDAAAYFPTEEMRAIVYEAFTIAKLPVKFDVSVKVSGGGIHSQAEALRHGIARALIVYDLETRKKLKKEGFLKRDPRAKERRKFGLKKARKAAQWSKR